MCFEALLVNPSDYILIAKYLSHGGLNNYPVGQVDTSSGEGRRALGIPPLAGRRTGRPAKGFGLTFNLSISPGAERMVQVRHVGPLWR